MHAYSIEFTGVCLFSKDGIETDCTAMSPLYAFEIYTAVSTMLGVPPASRHITSLTKLIIKEAYIADNVASSDRRASRASLASKAIRILHLLDSDKAAALTTLANLSPDEWMECLGPPQLGMAVLPHLESQIARLQHDSLEDQLAASMLFYEGAVACGSALQQA